ncbi:MAG: hypothetical protein Q7K65_02765 [Candidatus Buchananbacteria bacterium]|nr:hypothetical protein [Candidatus Buchananbacteria bacterium]
MSKDKNKIKIGTLVSNNIRGEDWDIGKVIGMENLELSVGPVLIIRDVRTDRKYRALATNVSKLVAEP